MRRNALWAVMLGVVSLGPGCRHGASDLRPAHETDQVLFDVGAAKEKVAGVEVQADVSAWTGTPGQLDAVIPMQVAISNQSGRPLQIRLKNFALLSHSGSRLAALPPLKIEGVEMTTARVVERDEGPGIGGSGISPLFHYQGVSLTRPYATHYGFDPVWDGPFGYEPGYYDVYYTRWPVELPTADMIAKAIPESVIQPGGELKGFVYFERPAVHDDRLRFQVELIDANTDQRFGTLEIPFVRSGT